MGQSFQTKALQVGRYQTTIKSSLHPFQIRDAGDGKIIIQRGRVYQLGLGGSEKSIEGTYGEDMSDDIYVETDQSKYIPVSVDDYVYLDISFTTDSCYIDIDSVKLEIGELPDPADDFEKFVPLALITSQDTVAGEKITKFDQLWRSDYMEVPFGSANDFGSFDVVTGLSVGCSSGYVTGVTPIYTTFCLYGRVETGPYDGEMESCTTGSP